MIRNEKDVNVRQISLLFLAFMPVTKLFTIPKAASETANEDMWLSILLCLALDFLTVVCLLITENRWQKPFSEILETCVGKAFSKVVLALYVLFFLLKAFPPLFEEENFVRNTFYESSPSAFTFLPFFFLSLYFCTVKPRAVGRLADLMWAFTVFSVALLLALSLEHTDYAALLPVGKNGVKIFLGSYYIFPWFSDGAYLLFFLGKIKPTDKPFLKVLGGFLGHVLLTVAFSVTFYGVFTFVAGRELFALAEISKYSTVINSVGRVDYIAIFLLLVTHIVSAALPLYVASGFLKELFGFKNPFIPSAIVNAVLLIPMLFLPSRLAEIVGILCKYLTPFYCLMGVVFPALLLFFVPKKPAGKITRSLKEKKGYGV